MRSDAFCVLAAPYRMLIEVRPKEAIVTATLARVTNLATLPEIAVKVLRLARDPNVTMSRLAEVISTAPELSARILRIVNSAFYGFPGEIRSIERATTLMGLESVRNVTIAASLMRVFQGRPLGRTFAPKDIWTHSLAVAAATRLLAVTKRLTAADEAFLAGLLHDIGLMVELQVHRLKLATMLTHIEGGDDRHILDLEEATFGATHQDFGASLLESWGLPETFAIVAGCHHSPYTAPAAERTLPVMVHVAERLVAAHSGHFLLDEQSAAVDEELIDELRLTTDQLNAVVDSLPAAVAEVTAVFNAS